MGLYINPKDSTKEQWVAAHAMPLDEAALRGWKYDADSGHGIVPIVVIDNGAFWAVGVLYSANERERFLSSLDYERRTERRARPLWFGFATVEDVRKVSDYDDYVGGD